MIGRKNTVGGSPDERLILLLTHCQYDGLVPAASNYQHILERIRIMATSVTVILPTNAQEEPGEFL